MERLFEILFKYRPLLFQEGDIAFAAPWPVVGVLLLGGAVAAAAAVTYTRAGGRAGPVDRAVMAGLRVSALALILFALFQPVLVLTSVVPQRNFLGILVDDSRSMRLADGGDAPRSAFVEQHFGPEGSELLDQLSERFSLRFFSFSSSARRIEGTGQLRWDGTRTELGQALDRAREELSSVPLSGLVVLTDGADNSGEPLARSLVPLQAASIPVFTVGLGEETISPDIQIGRVEVPRVALQGSALAVDVVLSHHGYAGREVTLRVEDGGRILAEAPVTLDGDGEPTVARVRFTLGEPGPRRLRFRVPPREGERVARNNVRDVLVEVRAAREKILYFEGEPRFEVKFIRRAVADDDNVQVVVLQRTAENKFLRLDVDDGDELVGGFPRSREELFQYRALILGSVEASFFTHDQLQMISEFVSQRGGGLLVLGGRNALAEGGFAGTPLEDALPVVLGPPVTDARTAFTHLRVEPTLAGLTHAATQLAPGEAPSEERWAALPELSTLNRIVEVKPGATTLLRGVTPDGEERVVLAHHRFGRGRALALPVQDTWTWQMHADVPLEDRSHEAFWTQLLRWLVEGVPAPVEGRVGRERVEAGEAVTIVADVADSTFLAVNDAQVTATVTGPDGSRRVLPMAWTVEADGRYAGSFTPPSDGDWEVALTATRGDEVLGVDDTWLRAGPSDEEYFDAGLRRPVLERVAEETGGRYYTPATVSSLPEDVQFKGGGVTLVEERDLWDAPAILLLLLLLVGAEWGFRRLRGLV